MSTGDIFNIRDESQIERLVGTLNDPLATTGHVLTVQADKSIKAAPGGGGSQPGATYFLTMQFDEPAGPSADLVATLPIPAGSRVVDVQAISLAAGHWADNCSFNMGDTAQAAGYANSDIGSMAIQSAGIYTPTNGNGACSIGTGNYSGAYGSSSGDVFYSDQSSSSTTGAGVPYATDDTITATLGGIVTGGGGGSFLIAVMIVAPVTPVVAA